MRSPENIKILIGCETSGRVRNEFLRLGFDCFSCDILPSDDKSNRHYTCDVRDALDIRDWDMLAVMHPPCTRLCNSGVRWLHTPPNGKTKEQMWQELDDGAQLFSDCWNADIPCVAVENPVMHKYAKERIENFEPAAQTIQPWWFGDAAFKATGLYLRNLPALEADNKLTPPKPGSDEHKKWSMIHRASPGKNRWKIRSKTFPNVARAIAEQWGEFLVSGAKS